MEKPNIKEYSNTPLLNGKKYPLWNIMMDVELTAHGLKDICSSEIASNADSTTIRNWNCLNGKAVHLILSRIHPTLLVSFVDTHFKKHKSTRAKNQQQICITHSTK
ncbi:hypothetical protein O181_099919 [Austropuccinia psidii MF-1]|uniref:Uncharacterized protein n=1 Tax=Austropuccinia psidii MF-1 TaxID=1389203 RepID=A0A9Q3JDM2_9BASI|nr:hypothetical protein [Austropuccinia psidii MF-1]